MSEQNYHPSKKPFFVLVVVLMVVAAVMYTTTTTPDTTTSTITRTNTGFEPSLLLVREGTKVIFINASDEPTWPAANNHPDHASYPVNDPSDCLGSSFDACRSLAPGETWEFVFTVSGSWTYHDHLEPSLGGFILVTNDPNPETQQQRGRHDFSPEEMAQFTAPTVPEFFALPDEEQFRTITILSQRSAKEAWQYLLEIGFAKDFPEHLSSHDFGHIVGAALYEQEGLNGFSVCDSSFLFACYHGIIDEALRTEGAENLTHVVAACAEDAFVNINKKTNLWCYHGIGHGVASLNNNDIDTSLHDCDELIDDPKQRNVCYRGVYMYVKSGTFADFDKETIWDQCAGLEPEYQNACGFFKTVVGRGKNMFGSTPGDIQNICTTAPNYNLKLSCISYVSRLETALPIQEASVDQVDQECSYFTSQDDRDDCIMTAALLFTANRYNNEVTASNRFAHELCDRMETQRLTDACIRTIEVDRLTSKGMAFLDLFPSWRN